MFLTWGVKSTDLSDLRRLAQALSNFDNIKVSDLCSELEGIGAGGERFVPKKAKKGGKSKLDSATVDKYVEELTDEALNYDSMQSILSNLASDRAAKMSELTAIASKLAGVDSTFKNKGEAQGKIESIVRRRLDTSRRLQGTSGIF